MKVKDILDIIRRDKEWQQRLSVLDHIYCFTTESKNVYKTLYEVNKKEYEEWLEQEVGVELT